MAAVAKDLRVNRETRACGIKAAEAPEESEAPSAGANKDAEIAALRQQVRELELERGILRRAAEQFAGETNW